MTLQLPLSTRQLLVNTLADLMDVGTAQGTGSVQFIDSGDVQLALIDENANVLQPALPFFGPAVPVNGTTDGAPMTISNIEDDSLTVGNGNPIVFAVFRNRDQIEQFRSDVATASADIIMTNPIPSTNDPVRLSTYQVRAVQDN